MMMGEGKEKKKRAARREITGSLKRERQLFKIENGWRKNE
jgi:hypothetical protein